MPKSISFRFQPLLFLLVPSWAVIYGLIPGFQNHEYALISSVGNKGITAGSMSLFNCYSSATTMTFAFSLIGLIAAIWIGVYGLFAAFLPKLRGVKTMSIVVLVSLGLMVTGYIAASIMLVNCVDAFTRDFYLAQSGTFATYNAYAFINANFVLGLALPSGLLAWWAVVFVTHLAKKA